MEVEKYRDFSVDIAKGIGIILVVWAHTRMSSLLFSFHMPLFFILSGFFLKDENTRDFLYKKFRTLVVPLLVFYVFSLVTKIGLRYLTKSREELLEKIYDGSMFNLTTVDVTLWFIVCLLIMLTLYHYINKYITSIYFKILVVSLLCIIGLFYGLKAVYIPCYILQAMICLPLLYLGKIFNNKIKEHLSGLPLLSMSVVMFIASYTYWQPKSNLMQMQLSGVLQFYIPAISGSFMIIGLSQIIAKVSKLYIAKILSSVGVMSLFVMCLSEDVRFAFEFCKGITNHIYINTAIETLIIVVVTYLIGVFIDRYLPFIYKNVPIIEVKKEEG